MRTGFRAWRIPFSAHIRTGTAQRLRHFTQNHVHSRHRTPPHSRFQQLPNTNCSGYEQSGTLGPDSQVKGWGEAEDNSRVSGDFLNFTVPNARGADLHPFAGTLDEGAHRLEIDIPAALRDVMSVADTVAKLRPAATYFANLCHKTEISRVVRTHSIPNSSGTSRGFTFPARWSQHRPQSASRRCLWPRSCARPEPGWRARSPAPRSACR